MTAIRLHPRDAELIENGLVSFVAALTAATLRRADLADHHGAARQFEQDVLLARLESRVRALDEVAGDVVDVLTRAREGGVSEAALRGVVASSANARLAGAVLTLTPEVGVAA